MKSCSFLVNFHDSHVVTKPPGSTLDFEDWTFYFPKSRRGARLNNFIPIQVGRGLNRKLANWPAKVSSALTL